VIEIDHWNRLSRIAIVELQDYDKAMELIYIMQQVKAEIMGWA